MDLDEPGDFSLFSFLGGDFASLKGLSGPGVVSYSSLLLFDFPAADAAIDLSILLFFDFIDLLSASPFIYSGDSCLPLAAGENLPFIRFKALAVCIAV